MAELRVIVALTWRTGAFRVFIGIRSNYRQVIKELLSIRIKYKAR